MANMIASMLREALALPLALMTLFLSAVVCARFPRMVPTMEWGSQAAAFVALNPIAASAEAVGCHLFLM